MLQVSGRVRKILVAVLAGLVVIVAVALAILPEVVRRVAVDQVPKLTGRVLALETLTNTPAVANVIREAKTYMLPGIIQTGKKQGMQLMDDALMDLFDRQLISDEEACARSEQKEMMRQHVGKG